MLIVLPVWGKGGFLVLLLLGVRAVCYILALRLVGIQQSVACKLFHHHLYIVCRSGWGKVAYWYNLSYPPCVDC